MKRRSSRVKTAWKLAVAALLAIPSAIAGADPLSEAQAAERLVRQTYYEGIPFEAARAVTPAGAARLVEMLRDPAERSHAANAVLVLGIAAHPGAYEAIEAVAEPASSGEVDRPTYRLLDAVPFAMGYLAQSDERAFAWLLARARVRGADPGWSHGPFRGQRLADQQRRRAIAGLGLSGRPDVPALLDEIEAAGAIAAQRRSAAVEPDPELEAALDSARETSRRIARDGAGAALTR